MRECSIPESRSRERIDGLSCERKDLSELLLSPVVARRQHRARARQWFDGDMLSVKEASRHCEEWA